MLANISFQQISRRAIAIFAHIGSGSANLTTAQPSAVSKIQPFSILSSSLPISLPNLTLPSSLSGVFTALHQQFPTSALFPAILLAVPKSRTTHGKKRMRMSNKGIKNLENITDCQVCGSPKLMHHLCGNCLGKIRKEQTKLKKSA